MQVNMWAPPNCEQENVIEVDEHWTVVMECRTLHRSGRWRAAWLGAFNRV